MNEVILTHHRSRRRILATNMATVVLMIPFLCFLAWMFEFRVLPVLMCLGLFAFNLAMFGHSTWKVLGQCGGFTCSLYRDRIRCDCPDDTMGSTFDLALSDVREIRRERVGDGPSKYILVATDGDEYWLTKNFGNPAAAFVRELRTICPNVKYSEL